jgi:hypothetical protein
LFGHLAAKAPDRSITADDSIKISSKTTIDIHAGSDLTIDGSSNTKITASSPCAYDAPKIDIA